MFDSARCFLVMMAIEPCSAMRRAYESPAMPEPMTRRSNRRVMECLPTTRKGGPTRAALLESEDRVDQKNTDSVRFAPLTAEVPMDVLDGAVAG